MQDRNARIGFALFCVYLLLYGGFVFLSAFSPSTMEMRPIAGVNLAILYGFGLIIAALALALVYAYVCRTVDESSTEESTGNTTASENDSTEAGQ